MFGIGANMSVEVGLKKKGVTVIEHTPAVAKGWIMKFNTGGMDMVEPSFANANNGSEDDEIHGMAYSLSEADGEIVDKQEGGGRAYESVPVEVVAYDGRKI